MTRDERVAAVMGEVDADRELAREAAADPRGFAERRNELRAALDGVRRADDLAALPPNDLVSSPVVEEMRAAGAFRADVTGAGPAVYGLFRSRNAAEEAERLLGGLGRTWATAPEW